MIQKLARVALVALLVACSKTKEPPPSQVNVIPPPPSAKSADEGPEPHVDLESLPTEEQYEEEAEKAITPKTLVKKVDELEKEILGK